PFPQALVSFTPYSGNPVFTGAAGQWDAQIRERGWIMAENGQYRMWYTGYADEDGRRMLGHATSPDGITWTRDDRNPIHRDHWVEDMCIVKRDGTYYMFAESENDRAHWFTSADGISWTREGTMDIR